MAGFALIMTALTFLFFGLITATVLSVALYVYAKRKLPENSVDRRRIVRESASAPFAGLLWLVIAFAIHVQVSNRLAHQDCGFSADPYVTLPNGYVVGSLNTYSGYIHAPGVQTDVPSTGPGYVRSIVDVSFSGNRFTGTYFDHQKLSIRAFSLDAGTRALQVSDIDTPASRDFERANPTEVDKFGAIQTLVHEDALSYWNLYAQYRHTWPSYVLAGLVIVGELATILWVRRLWLAA